MTVAAVLLVSAVLGLGITLGYRAVAEPPATLQASLYRTRQARIEQPRDWLDRLVRFAEPYDSTMPSADLEVLGWSGYDWRRRKVVFAIVSALVGVVLTVGARLYVPFPLWLAVVFVAGVFGAVGLAVVESDRATKASAIRNEIRLALTQFLELTSIMLAAGAGAETALEQASIQGRGRGFDLFSREVARAKEDPRLSAFTALRDLGDRIGISELTDFGNVMILSSESSTTVRQALDDKASLIVLREQESRKADANSRNVWMSIPAVGMAGGFILWLMYAALAALSSF